MKEESTENILPPMKKFVGFWIVLVFPWILDFLGHERVMTSLFGATLWGGAIAVEFARTQTKDLRLRRLFLLLLVGIIGLWTLYWVRSFGLSQLESPEELSSQSETLRHSLVWLHAGLLASGLGMVLFLWLSSIGSMAQEKLLKKSSWDRRSLPFKLPSLEALERFSHGAVFLAFITWGLGFLIALINGILSWPAKASYLSSQAAQSALRPELNAFNFSWLFDGKVLSTALLWLILVTTFQLSHIGQPKLRNRVYFICSSLFLSLFVLWVLVLPSSHLHQPISWFH